MTFLLQRGSALHRLELKTLLSCTFLLAGCATTPLPHALPSAPKAAAKLRGSIFGGQQPIAGAAIQLYAAGTSGDQSASSPLLNTSATSDATGSFNLDGLYTCPSDQAQVFLTATGGNPGYAAGTNNQASALMLSLGPCSGLASIHQVVVNEVTTVAAVYPLTQFMASFAKVGAAPANAALLADDFAESNQFVNIATGLPQTSSSTLLVPTQQLNALANSVAACVNSSGGVAGDGSACGTLFSDTTPAGGTAPTNTTDALLNLANNPSANTTDIYNLADAAPPFEPAVSKAPASWALEILPAMPVSVPQRGNLLGEYLLGEGSGTLAHDTSGHRNTASITGATWEGTVDLNFTQSGQYLFLPTALNAAQAWQFAFYQPPYLPAYSPVGPQQPPAYSSPGDRPYYQSLLCSDDTAHLCLLNSSGGTPRSLQRFAAFNTDLTEPQAFVPFGWHVFTLLCGAPGPIKTHYLYDGVEVPSYISQGDTSTCPILSTASGTGNYQVGGSSRYQDQSWFIGKVAAVWAWNQTLSLSDGATAAQAALAYLTAKGVPASYAPVDVTTPQVVAGLDSRTFGEGVTQQQAWPSAMTLIDTSYVPVNLGLVAAQVQEMCLQFPLVYGPLLASSQPSIVALWGGVNDILQTNQTSQQIANSLHCMVSQAKATGARVILATEISSLSSQSTRGDDGKNGLNAILRAQAWSWGIDNLADLATDPALGADGASSNTNIFPDGLHPNVNGQPRIAAMMGAAVNELLGSTSSRPTLSSNAAYQEQAGDRFLALSGNGQTITLPTCVGLSLQRQIINQSTTVAAVQTLNNEVLSGQRAVPPNSTVTFTPMPGPAASAGCSWSTN